MGFRYSIVLNLLGQLKDRFSVYQQVRTLEEKLAIACSVEGVTGVEMVFPDELADIELTRDLLAKHNLRLSSVNVNLKGDPRWHQGALTASDGATRAEAVRWIVRGMEIAADLGSNLVTMCPLADGHDYPFEIDFNTPWNHFIQGVQSAADSHPDVRLSLEYKASEPRAQVIIGTVGKTLYACDQIDRANVGVTLDTGHALFAGEHAAQSAALLSQARKLFLVHGNDNYRNWDWDMVPGSVNFWDFLESTFYLMRDYDGWIAFDVSPSRFDPAQVMQCSVRMFRVAEAMVTQVGPEQIERSIVEGPMASMGLFLTFLEGRLQLRHVAG
jgi:xylose isomerase